MGVLPAELLELVMSFCSPSAFRALGLCDRACASAGHGAVGHALQRSDVPWMKGFWRVMQDAPTFQAQLLALRWPQLRAFNARSIWRSTSQDGAPLCQVGRVLYIDRGPESPGHTVLWLLALDRLSCAVSADSGSGGDRRGEGHGVFLLHFTERPQCGVQVGDRVHCRGLGFRGFPCLWDRQYAHLPQYRGQAIIRLARPARGHSLPLLHLAVLAAAAPAPLWPKATASGACAAGFVGSALLVRRRNSAAGGLLLRESSPTPPAISWVPTWPSYWVLLLLSHAATLPSQLALRTYVYEQVVFACHDPGAELMRALPILGILVGAARLATSPVGLALLCLGYRLHHLLLVLGLWLAQTALDHLLQVGPRYCRASQPAYGPVAVGALGLRRRPLLLPSQALQSAALHLLVLLLPCCPGPRAVATLGLAVLPDLATQVMAE